jgi:hypothetical protein
MSQEKTAHSALPAAMRGNPGILKKTQSGAKTAFKAVGCDSAIGKGRLGKARCQSVVGEATDAFTRILRGTQTASGQEDSALEQHTLREKKLAEGPAQADAKRPDNEQSASRAPKLC